MKTSYFGSTWAASCVASTGGAIYAAIVAAIISRGQIGMMEIVWVVLISIIVSLPVLVAGSAAIGWWVSKFLARRVRTNRLLVFAMAGMLMGLIMKPHILVLILAAAFTDCAPRRPPDGTVVVRFFVNEQGEVENVQVVSSANSKFTKSAVSSVRKWRFKPTVKDGKPVKTTVEKTMEFRLKDEAIDSYPITQECKAADQP